MAEIYEFLAMGGYARFVWPAYGIALILIGGLALQSVRSLRALRREIATLEDGEPGRSRRVRARPDSGNDDAA